MSKAQDPFAPTTDPALYVPRQASEQALDELIEASVKGTQLSLLLGETGMGKSLLLRVLARRAESDLHCIHVPVPTLDPEGVTLWISTRLPGGRRPAGTEALLEVASERPLLLLVEDAELLPAESAQTLAELHRASAGAIRAVLAINDSDCPEHLSLAFDPEANHVALVDAMTRDEVSDYVARRLAAAGVPQSVAERFGPSAIVQIHESSRGVPVQVNQAARRLMSSAARPLTLPSPTPSTPSTARPAPPLPAARPLPTTPPLPAAPPARPAPTAPPVPPAPLMPTTPPAPTASTAPPVPETRLWQDPEPPIVPEHELPHEPPSPRRNRASWRRGRGLGWGIAAGLVPFIAGITIGVWLRPNSPLDDASSAAEADTGVDTEIAAPTLPSAPALPNEGARETRSSDTDAPTLAAERGDAPTAPATTVAAEARTERAARPTPALPTSDAAEGNAGSPGTPRTPDVAIDRDRSQVATAPPPLGERAVTNTPRPAVNGSGETRVFGEPELDAEGATVGVEVAGRPRLEPARPQSTPAPSGAAPGTPTFRALPLSEDVVAASPGASTANELILNSEPPAFIEIDGRPVGATPILVAGLRPGPHRLVAHFETGETMTREIVVGNERSEVMLRGPLRRAPLSSTPPGARLFER